MAEQPSLIKNILKKGVIGTVIGIILYVVSNALGFPPLFQGMFFAYAMLGTAVFILLDAPEMGRLEGVKAIAALVAFYMVLSVVYVGGASLWPQYDPEIEKGKINKLLKRRKILFEQAKPGILLEKNIALTKKAEELMDRLKNLKPAGGPIPDVEIQKSTGPGSPSGDPIFLGQEQWNLQECYNCHVISRGEKAKKKKRGPNLDNIGNMMTPEQMKEKILDPKSWMAEGFEKQYKKGKMPDKYKDLMFDDEIEVLVAFLATLKDPSAPTPKPIKKN